MTPVLNIPHHRRHGASPARAHLTGWVCLLALAGLSTTASAQTVYRIVAPDGHVTFSDKPPVTGNKATPFAAGTSESGAMGTRLPYELAQVAGKFPVTLYTSAECAPCDDGRKLLRARGIPFTEKTVNTAEDAQSLKSLSDSASLPLLTIGGQQLKGFSTSQWDQFLSAAGYPSSSQLPAAYRNPPASPLVTVQAPVATTPANPAPVNAPQAPATVRPAVSPGNPAGIQF